MLYILSPCSPTWLSSPLLGRQEDFHAGNICLYACLGLLYPYIWEEEKGQSGGRRWLAWAGRQGWGGGRHGREASLALLLWHGEKGGGAWEKGLGRGISAAMLCSCFHPLPSHLYKKSLSIRQKEKKKKKKEELWKTVFLAGKNGGGTGSGRGLCLGMAGMAAAGISSASPKNRHDSLLREVEDGGLLGASAWGGMEIECLRACFGWKQRMAQEEK